MTRLLCTAALRPRIWNALALVGQLWVVTSICGAPGEQRWQYVLPSGSSSRISPAIGADGSIYVTTDDGKLYAIEAGSGKQKWSFKAGNAYATPPVIGTNGTIFGVVQQDAGASVVA